MFYTTKINDIKGSFSIKTQRTPTLGNYQISTFIDLYAMPNWVDWNIIYRQGSMQDQIIASYTCFSGHMGVNC